jgi:hypothetical protein
VKEHATQGTLALFSDMASTAVSGMAGLAKAAIVGRDDGYRAGKLLIATFALGHQNPSFVCSPDHESCTGE